MPQKKTYLNYTNQTLRKHDACIPTFLHPTQGCCH